jgi:8-oxo-dGTP diphosphatase
MTLKQVAAAVIFQQGRVLVTRRGPGQNLAGWWEFPGGKLEGDETPQDCVVRELREELGVTVTAHEIIVESPHDTINLIAVRTEMAPQPLTLSVHDAYDWVEPAALLSLKLPPADIPIAQAIIDQARSAAR